MGWDVPSLTLTLQESQNVVGPYGALHVTDDAAAGVVQELNSDLGDTSTRASAAEDLAETSQTGLSHRICRTIVLTLVTAASLTGTFCDES